MKAPQPGDSIRAAIKKVSRGATTVSIIQAAMLLGIGRDAAYAAAESGALPTLKICARRWRVSTAVIERLLLGEDA